MRLVLFVAILLYAPSAVASSGGASALETMAALLAPLFLVTFALGFLATAVGALLRD